MASILDIILRTIKQGSGVQQTEAEVKKLEGTLGGVTNVAGKVNQVLGMFGLAVGAAEAVRFAAATREAARAENDAINALRVASQGIADYNEALRLGRESTRGMASDQEIASAQATLFGAGLAQSAQEAAQLATAGTILSNVFAAAGASQEMYVRLLSSGSPVLYNNFGLTAQMVNAKKDEIEATTNLRGEEAKMQALKEILIAQADKYKNALSAESTAAAQAAAAQSNFMASFGQLINALDQSTGATTGYTTALNKLTEGAKAWEVILNQQIPAIQQAETAMAANAAQIITTSSSYDELEAATDAAAQNQAAFQQSLLENVDTHAEYQAAIDKVAQSDISLAGSLDLTEAQFTELKNAMADAVVTSGAWVSSLNAMNITAANTIATTARLTQEQQNLAATARAQAGAFGGQADDFSQGLNLSRLQQAGDQRLAYQEQQRQAEIQAQQEAAKQSEQVAKQQATAMTKAFDQVGQQISSAVSSAVSQSSTDIAKLLGIDAEAEQRVNENVRRMAAVATGGLANEWTQQLATQLQGVDSAQAFVNAVSQGNNAATMEEARKLALNPIVEMFDANAIAGRIEQQLRAQQLQQQLNDKVNALLGEKGLQAVTDVTQQVTQAATDTGTATTQVNDALTGLGGNAETAGAAVSTGFDNAVTKIQLVNQLIRETIGLTQRWGEVTQSAVDRFNSVGPGAATQPNSGVPTTAQKKMGGDAKL